MVGGYEASVKKLWHGKCDVYVRDTVINPTNGRNEPVERAI